MKTHYKIQQLLNKSSITELNKFTKETQTFLKLDNSLNVICENDYYKRQKLQKELGRTGQSSATRRQLFSFSEFGIKNMLEGK